MSKKIYIDAFFNQYEDFLTQLKEVFPEDRDFPLYLAGLAIFRRTNPGIIAQKTWKHVSRFEEVIKKRDEEFFVKRDFSDITEGEEPLEQTVAKIRGMWSSLDDHNKKMVWEFINNITALAKMCVA
jgi:DNA-binding Lrp family transcriptional regulator